MTSIAILMANAAYTKQRDLPCCLEDLRAIEALIRALGRHEQVVVLPNADADAMREAIRSAVKEPGPRTEILFYFSGHGASIGSEFYFCGTEFDAGRPNQTGLSHTELHDLMREASPDLFVKIVDACASGTLLVKDSTLIPSFTKDGFRNVVQFSSCLEEQSSLAGEPLSEFTEALCEACLTRETGPIYYSDVINSLRDEYLENDEQTPFFVAQGTGRHLFVDDAGKLSDFRARFETEWSSRRSDDEIETSSALPAPAAPLSPVELLRAAESKFAAPARATSFIAELFDGLKAELDGASFLEFYEASVQVYSGYYEPTARSHIIKVLSSQTRPDRFVTAELKRPVGKALFAIDALAALNRDYDESWDLELNCSVDQIQLRVALTPRFTSLQRYVLVVSCAPSLEECYIFEMITQHLRSNWDTFQERGKEIVRRYYTNAWDESASGMVARIAETFEQTVGAHIEGVIKQLSPET